MRTTAYAAYCTDDNIRMNSSSGGIYALLAEYIINAGGVVFAACYDDKLDVVHREISAVRDIAASMGSKYAASRLGDTFRKVKAYLDKGTAVLFAGLPCQCAGLRSFAKDSDKLICVDLVCHGVPGLKAWHAYKDSLKKRGAELLGVNMRDKSSGWTGMNYSWRMTFPDGETVRHNMDITYMYGFTRDFYLRPSCYECAFRGIERDSDITLGDYWGVEKLQPEADDGKGTSLVMVHTERGEALFDAVRDRLFIAEADAQKAVRYNKSIAEPAVLTKKREAFFKRISRGGDFILTVEKLKKPALSARVRAKIKGAVKRIIKWGEVSK